MGDFFRNTWGEYAGWAHSVLFAADLRDLNNGQSKNTTKSPEAEAPTKTKKRVRVKSEEDKENISDITAKVEIKLETTDDTIKINAMKTDVTESKKHIPVLGEELVHESVSERLKKRRRVKV